nr:hypothetical protein [Tanacetum cinerariifolium]
ETENSLSIGDEHLDTISATESDEVIKSSVEDLIPIPSEFEGILDTMCDVHFDNNSTPFEAKDQLEIVLNNDISSSDDDSLHEENINYVEASPPDSELVSSEVMEIVSPEVGQIEDFFESINEVSSIDDDSFSIDNINYVEALPLDSELVSSEVMEIVSPEVGGIDDDIPLTIKDENLREKLSNVNLLIATIEALNDNPTPSSDCKTNSSSTSLNSLLEETNTFHNSLPEFENFYFDLGEISSGREISSGSTTTRSDISLPDYEAFYFDDDHIKEISSGSTTTHSDISLFEYESFIFEEFFDELTHIISPPEYDCFYFKELLNQGELMSMLNFGIHESFSTTLVNLPIEDDHSPLLAYVVWIFVAYLTYPVIPPYLHPISSAWSFQEIQYSPQSLE